MVAPSNSVPVRIGHGHDIHALHPGGELWLGGVLIGAQYELDRTRDRTSEPVRVPAHLAET